MLTKRPAVRRASAIFSDDGGPCRSRPKAKRFEEVPVAPSAKRGLGTGLGLGLRFGLWLPESPDADLDADEPASDIANGCAAPSAGEDEALCAVAAAGLSSRLPPLALPAPLPRPEASAPLARRPRPRPELRSSGLTSTRWGATGLPSNIEFVKDVLPVANCFGEEVGDQPDDAPVDPRDILGDAPVGVFDPGGFKDDGRLLTSPADDSLAPPVSVFDPGGSKDDSLFGLLMLG